MHSSGVRLGELREIVATILRGDVQSLDEDAVGILMPDGTYELHSDRRPRRNARER